MAVRAACRVGQARVWTSSVFNVANSDSATALAKQVATWPMPWRSRPPPVPWCRRRRCTGRAATVGMMDQPSGGLAPVQGHLEGVHRELGAQVVGHGPTDHLAGAAVQDRGQIQPALLGGDGRRRCRRTRSGRARPGRTAAPPGPAPGWPWGRGGSGPAGGAVGPARVVVDLADTLQQLLVGPLAGGQAAVAPGIEAGTGDAKDPAQQADRVVCLLRRDEPAAAHRVVSLAKKAAAFFFVWVCRVLGAGCGCRGAGGAAPRARRWTARRADHGRHRHRPGAASCAGSARRRRDLGPARGWFSRWCGPARRPQRGTLLGRAVWCVARELLRELTALKRSCVRQIGATSVLGQCIEPIVDQLHQPGDRLS